jgi:hypothetical protein
LFWIISGEQLEKIVESFNNQLKTVNSNKPYSGREMKRLSKLFQDEMDEVIDKMYSLTSKKQKEAEKLHIDLMHIDWPNKQYDLIDQSLTTLVNAYGSRILSISNVVLEYFRIVEGKFRQAK